jgi:hypothetical protein
MDSSGHPVNVSAWTVDISAHGVRVRGVSDWSEPGETIGVRHGPEKARFKIVWVGTKDSPNEGQVGLKCVEAGKYIWGLAAPQVAAAAAAPAAGSVTSHFPSEPQVPIGLSSSTPSANNRRKAARYKANGGARVRETGGTAAQWATLHDLSLGGCYVETTAPLPPTSQVEIVIHINDIQITAKGFVTVCHKLVGMGVQFSDVSHLNRTRLEQVMAVLTETSTEA